MAALFYSLLALTAAGNFTSTGSTVTLNGIPYYIPGTPLVSIPNFKARTLAGTKSLFGGLVPVTVVGTSLVTFNLINLQQTVKEFGEKDDVWGEAFLSGIKPDSSPKVRGTIGLSLSHTVSPCQELKSV